MKPYEPKSGELTADEKKRIFMTLDAQTVLIEKFDRGMYGDKENRVKGLNDRVETIESYILKTKFKVTFIAGACAVVSFEAHRLWEWCLALVSTK